MSPDGSMLAYALGNDFSKGPEYFNEFPPKLCVHFIPDNELRCARWLILIYHYYTDDCLLGCFVYVEVGSTIWGEANSEGWNNSVYLNYLIPFIMASLSNIIL